MSDPLLTEKEVNAEIAKRSNLSDKVTQAAFFVGATWGAQKVRKKMEARAQPAQAGQVLTAMEAMRIGAKHSEGLSHTREFTEEGFLACVAEIESAVLARVARVPPDHPQLQTSEERRATGDRILGLIAKQSSIVGEKGCQHG